MRRRRLPRDPALVEAHVAFLRCAAHVDLAQRAMLRCVPSSARSTALPLAVGSDTFRLALDDARTAMPDWRHPAVEVAWTACTAAIDEALALVDSAVSRAAGTDELEVALTAVAELIAPLDAFVDAEQAFTRMLR